MRFSEVVLFAQYRIGKRRIVQSNIGSYFRTRRRRITRSFGIERANIDWMFLLSKEARTAFSFAAFVSFAVMLDLKASKAECSFSYFDL